MTQVTQILKWLRPVCRSRSGIAAVEFVLILPIFALLLFGTIDIGRLLFDYQAVSKSVRDSARYVARTDVDALFSNLGTCTVDLTVAPGSPAQNARNMALTGTADGSGDYILQYWTDETTVNVSSVCFDNSAGTYQGLFSGNTDIPIVAVAATVSFPWLNGWLLGQSSDLTFTVRHEEVFIGE